MNSNAPKSSSRSPISIALLLYIITLCGIVSAVLSKIRDNETTTWQSLAWAIGLGWLAGFFLAVFLGTVWYRRIKAAFACLLTGSIVGPIAGGMVLVDSKHLPQLAIMVLGGCWLLLLVFTFSYRYIHVGPSNATNQQADSVF